jgi:LAO/AO transport system kinase
LAECEGDWQAKVLMVSARARQGVEGLVEAVDGHAAHLEEGGRLASARKTQATEWLEASLRERFGREGLRKAGPQRLAEGESPFDRLAVLARDLG